MMGKGDSKKKKTNKDNYSNHLYIYAQPSMSNCSNSILHMAAKIHTWLHLDKEQSSSLRKLHV